MLIVGRPEAGITITEGVFERLVQHGGTNVEKVCRAVQIQATLTPQVAGSMHRQPKGAKSDKRLIDVGFYRIPT